MKEIKATKERKGSKPLSKSKKSKKSSKTSNPRKNSKGKYQELYMNYLDHGLSQTSLLIIRRIASNPEIPSYFRNQPLLRFIESAVSELLMNEFEITLFGIYLESFGWEDKEYPLELIMACSGLLVKKQLSQQAEIILGHFESIFPSFAFSFKSWEIKYEHLTDIDSRHINLKYDSYSSAADSPEERIINYNYLVDDILRTSLSYNIAEPITRENGANERGISMVYTDQVLNRVSPRNGKSKELVTRKRPKCIVTKGSTDSDMVVEPKSIINSCSSALSPLNYSSGFMLGRVDSFCTELQYLSRPLSIYESQHFNSSMSRSLSSGLLEVSRNTPGLRDIAFSLDERMEKSPDLYLSPIFKTFVPADDCKRMH